MSQAVERSPEPEDRPQRWTRSWPPPADVVALARQGDRDVLGEILTMAFPKVVAFARAMGLSAAEAEDLGGDVCERVVRSVSGLRDPQLFEAWFWSISRNRLRSFLRGRSRSGSVVEPMHPGYDSPEERVAQLDEHAGIARAFEQLSLRDRQVLWLREVLDLDDDEVGAALGLRRGAVRVAAMRARRRLEQAYLEERPAE